MGNPYRFAIIIPIGKLAEASAIATAVFGDPPVIAPENFAVRLAASGSEPATHLGGCGALSDAQLAMVSGNLPTWVKFYRWHVSTHALLNSSEGLELGQTWSWAKSIENAGLVRIFPPPAE